MIYIFPNDKINDVFKNICTVLFYTISVYVEFKDLKLFS